MPDKRITPEDKKREVVTAAAKKLIGSGPMPGPHKLHTMLKEAGHKRLPFNTVKAAYMRIRREGAKAAALADVTKVAAPTLGALRNAPSDERPNPASGNGGRSTVPAGAYRHSVGFGY